jgi:HAD superfamily hydrolase (TIGR01490 family)
MFSLQRRVFIPFLAGLITACSGKPAPSEPWTGFTDENSSRLRKAASGSGVVVFDADGTLWRGDAGEDFFLWQLENKVLLPERLPGAKQSWDEYKSSAVSERDIWIEVTRCQAGLTEEQVTTWAREFFSREMASRVFPGMKDAISRLQIKGMDVWIVSASHRWIIGAGAEHLGVPADHVIAVQTVVKDGVITDEIVEPVPFREGKVDAIKSVIGGQPIIAFGDSMNDVPMLKYARSLAVVINPSDALRKVAVETQWAIQSFE